MPSKSPLPPEAEMVKKVLTFKSGNVPFSRNIQEWKGIVGDLTVFEVLLLSLGQLPILPALAARLESDLIRRAIFGTAAIEGNPLTEEQVGEILEEPSLNGLRERAEQEIVNLKEAYRRYAAASPPGAEPLPVTEEFIREINALVTRNVATEHHSPGAYRDHPVEVGNAEHGGTYRPPRMRADIQPLMQHLTDWFNSGAMLAEPPAVRAALAHYHLGLIHPFGDGNGRTARLLEVAILARAGHRYVPTMLSNYYYRNMDAYYVAFRACEKSPVHDMTPFVALMTAGLRECVLDLQKTIHTHVRLLALGDHYGKLRQQKTVGQRQHDLLMILLQTPEAAVTQAMLRTDPRLAPLYRRVSEATQRRDLKRLQELGLLAPADGGGLRLNQFTLG